ncbi:MAG: SIS domain-containing protein [Chloroflexota bacterium]
MLGAAAELPAQVRDAWAITRSLTLPEAHRSVTAVAVLGMGGSAIGGDLVRGIWADRLRVPVEVVRGYDIPAWVGPSTLVVASSYSGGTEETISAFGQAAERKAPCAVISTGGTLLDVARRARLPHLAFQGGGQPRASVGYAVTLLAGLLERAGLLDLGDADVEAAAHDADIRVAASAPSCRPPRTRPSGWRGPSSTGCPSSRRPGSLARSHGAGRRSSTRTARRPRRGRSARGDPQRRRGLPAAGHLKDHLIVVFLEGDDDHARNRLRARLSRELVEAAGISSEVVTVTGDGRFGQALDAIVRGDFASIYLAALYGVDPTPVEPITMLKAAMSLADASDADADVGDAGA